MGVECPVQQHLSRRTVVGRSLTRSPANPGFYSLSSCSSLLSSSSRPSETQTSLSKRSQSGVAEADLNPPTNRCCPRQSGLSHQQAAGWTKELSVNSDYARAQPIPARLIICDQPHVCFFPFRALAICSEAAANHRPLFGPPAAIWHVHPHCAVSASNCRAA